MLDIGHRISGKGTDMAGPENMAEDTPISEQQAPQQESLGARTRRFIEAGGKIEGGAQDPLDMEPEDAARFNRLPQGSLRKALMWYEHVSRIPMRGLPDDLQTILRLRREVAREDLLKIKQELLQEQGGNQIIEHVRAAALKFYKKVKSAKPNEIYGADKETVISSGRRGQYYQEVVFDDSPELKELESKYGGLPTYIFEGIVQEIDKEESSRLSPTLNPLVEEEFVEVKLRRERDRRREKKYITRETHYGVIYELSAENAGELPVAVLDFTKDKIFTLADTDYEGIYQEVNKIRAETLEKLEQNRVRLNEQGQNITESDPEFLRAKALAEAIPDVLGNEKMLYKGGEEYSTKYKERFAANFIGHDDAIYLENPKAALIMHLLTTVKDGTYWFGHGWNVEKASEGEIADYRRDIEEEIVEYAATNELFLSDEFFRAREKEGLRFSFNDPLEKILLDPYNEAWDRIAATGDREALRRHELRVEVFRRTKEMLDAQENLAGLTPEQRQAAIRQRVVQKMREKNKLSYLAQRSQEGLSRLDDARASNNLGVYDKELWAWVKDYNEYRIKLRLPKWYPSGWDRVKVSIDRPTRVLDRTLSGDQLTAMFEPSQLQFKLPEQLTEEEKREIDSKLDETRFGFMLGKSYQIFHMQDTLLGGVRARLVDLVTGKYTGRLPDDETSLALGLIRQAGTDAQGNPIYETIDPNRKLVRVFDVVQVRLQTAIDREAALINRAKAEKAAAIASGNQDLIKQTTASLKDIMLNAQFIATHAIKELGLVEGKLPVWSHNFLDQSTIDVFTKLLADYGVEVAPGVPITHNSKKVFYEIIERGRRGLKAEWDRATREFMVGTYPIFDEEGNPAKPSFLADRDFGTDIDSSPINERFRIVSKGAVKENRNKTETRFELSTSGGIAIPELIPDLGDLGFYSLLVWLGVTDIRGLHGYIKRRDEKEFHDHKYFDVMDPIQHARAEKAAIVARKFLTERTTEDGRLIPGPVREPFHGAFRIADFLRDHYAQLDSNKMTHTKKYLDAVRGWRQGIRSMDRDLETLRQMTYLEFNNMPKPMTDGFYKEMYDVIDYFQNYLKALKEVQSNRIGRAPRNWEYDMTLMWYAFRREIRKAMAAGEKGFVLRHKYSPEVASEISIKMMETVLEDADYIILKYFERERLAREGAQILFRALTDDERRNGFILSDGKRGFGISPEKDWPRLRPEIREALETVRRRGLLEFMREEGYKIGDKEVQGEKIPELVR